MSIIYIGMSLKGHWFASIAKMYTKQVKVGNDREMAQSERKFPLHKPRGGKKLK